MLKVLGITAAVTTASAVLAGCGGGSSSGGNSGSDATILDSAITAEGLAATLYANLIASPIYTNLSATNRGYLVAAYEQEVEHYNFLVASGGTALPTNTNFYFPTGMFTAGAGGYQTTFNTIEIIEDLLIAIYLIGVNNFSTGSLKLYSAQLLGVDSEHRVLARVVASSLGVSSTTNLADGTELTGGGSNSANNYEFERQFPEPLTSGITTVNTILTNNFQTLGASGNSQTAYPLTVTATLPNVSAINQDNTIEND
jgi:hypothetical protein